MKSTNVAITSHGSAGYEYPLKSIPTVICGESSYSGFGFNIEPKSKIQYYNILNKIHKIKKLDIETISKTKDLDAILIGPYDLSASLGVTGDFKNRNFTKVYQVFPI